MLGDMLVDGESHPGSRRSYRKRYSGTGSLDSPSMLPNVVDAEVTRHKEAEVLRARK